MLYWSIVILPCLLLLLRWDLTWASIQSLAYSLYLAPIQPAVIATITIGEAVDCWVALLVLVSVPAIMTGWQLREPGQIEVNTSALAESWRRFRTNQLARISLTVIVLLISLSLCAPFLTIQHPNHQQDITVTRLAYPLESHEYITVIDTVVTQEKVIRDFNTQLLTLIRNLGQELARAPRGRIYFDSLEYKGTQLICRQGPLNTVIELEQVLMRNGEPLVASTIFFLGSDQLGRDVLSRLLYGGRVSFFISLLAVLIAVSVGTFVGMVAGYFGGWTDGVLMRIVDVLLAFPSVFLVLILVALFGNSTLLLISVFGLTGWMSTARLVRAEVLSLREREFVQAARLLGMSAFRIIRKHLLPNSLAPVIVTATLKIGSIILIEAALSFLGLGIQPPTPSWGNMITEGKDSLLSAWWLSVCPGTMITVAVMAFNLIGDGLRDALDVRLPK